MEQSSKSHRQYKDELYAEFARIGSALGNARRLEILDLLSQRDERSVEDLASELGTTTGNTSQHLLALLRARLIEVRRQGTYAYYRIAGSDVADLWRHLRDVSAVRSAEVDAIVKRRTAWDGERDDIDVADLVSKVEQGDVLLLDARPIEEYRSGHLPGARLIEPESLTDELTTAGFDTGREIVVYCRGPYCVFAYNAVTVLRARGFVAHRLRLGVPEWRALGYAVAVGDPPA
ncbi:MAG: metalloregulator ArsR/SmtB family transcription factor [Candidatus Velthaea sp.]